MIRHARRYSDCDQSTSTKTDASGEVLMMHSGLQGSMTYASERASEMIVCVPFKIDDNALLLDYTVNFTAR